MFRRSRFSARPNVATGGRGAAAATTGTPQEAPPPNQEAGETPADTRESSTAASAVVENNSDVTSEKAAAPENGGDQNGEGASSSAAVQRRKRFSVKPKVAPGRPPALPRTPKSPIKSVSETPVELSDSGVEATQQAVSPRSGNTAATQGLQSPRRRRSSEGSKSPRVQPKPTLVSPDSSEPAVVPAAEDLPEQTHLPSANSSQTEKTSDSQVKEVPPARHPDKVQPSLPDRETNEISEKAKTLVSTKTALSLTASAYSLSRLLNGPSDLQRLVKAQKLRELLKQERAKDKTLKKARARSEDYSLDPAKMTMRDLIYYIPTSNPMSYSLEDSVQENETVVPPSPVREASPEPAQEPEAPPNNTANAGEGEEEDGDDEDEALMVPQVKVAEDGSLIIDEESLTVEVQRAKGPNPAQDRDPIFERGSTTTYSSFRKGTYTKPWSSEETDMFFLAVSMVGTDFSMICQLFPHRARSEIKNKFKKEEKMNAWRIDKAFKERRKLDIEYFSKLLEKIMEVQKNRKKLKSLAAKNAPKQRKRKAPAKKRARTLSNVEEVDEEDEDEVPDLEEEGEKENEDLCNEGDVPAAEPKRKSKRKKKTDAATEERRDKKSKAGNKSTDKGDAVVTEQAEADLLEDDMNSDNSQDAAPEKNPVIKPAKLSRARAAKPALPLGRKRSKKTAPPTKPKGATSDEEDENEDGSAPEEQVNKDASTSGEARKRKAANDEKEEESLRPTRYGRTPKPVKPLMYSDKDDSKSSTSESSSSAAKPKPKCTAKRGRSSKQQSAPKSKKPKLVTLWASLSEFSDDDNDGRWGGDEVEEQLPFGSSADNSTSGIVATGLHTLQSEISEVDESMVELDILASMPDVLGISQEALDSSCDQTQHETDTAEPCEHQLDLLVDVIDFLSSEHTEVSEEQSYNEAAQTLLTIGNVAHITQLSQNQEAIDEYIEGISEYNNSLANIEEQIASRPDTEEESAPSVSAQFGQDVTTTSETAATVEVKVTEAQAVGGEAAATGTSGQDGAEQQPGIELEPELLPNPESSDDNAPETNKGCWSKKKPTPNLTEISRTAQPKSQPEVSTGEASHAVASCPADAAMTAHVEIAPETQDCAPATLKVSRTDEPSYQETVVHQVEASAVVSDQTSSEVQSRLSTGYQFENPITSESRGEKLASSVETAEASLKDPVTEVDQETVTDLATDESTHNAPHAEDSPVTKKAESEVETTCQPRRGRLQKIKPNLPPTSRTARSKAQTTKPVETGSVSEPIKENLTSCSQTSETVPGTPAQQEIDSAPKQEGPSVVAATPVEEVQPTQEECNVVPSCQMRRSRFQKVKPNIAQSARSKPQTKKDLNPSSGSDVEPQPTCTLTLERLSQSTDPSSPVNPLINLDSTPEEVAPNEDKRTCPEPPSQVDFTSSSFEKRTSENKNLSKSPCDAAIEQSIREPGSTSRINDEILPAQVETAEISCQDLSTTDPSVTESPVAQDSSAHSASVQFQAGQDDDSASVPTCAKESPASQEQSPVASASQVRRGRSQKVRPKPILPQVSRTRRSKYQTTNEPMETETSLSSTVEVESQQTCPPSPEKTSQSAHSASTLNPSCNLIPPLVTTDELAAKESKESCSELSEEQDLTSPVDRSASKNSQVVSAVEQVVTDLCLTSSVTEENPVSHVQTADSGSTDVVTPDRVGAESQIGQGSSANSTSVQVQEDCGGPTLRAPDVKKLPASREDASVPSTSKIQRSRSQKIKPKPNLSQTRNIKHKPEPAEEPVAAEKPGEKTSIPTLRAEITDKSTAEVEMQPSCSATQPLRSKQMESAGVSVSECFPSAEQETKEPGLASSSEGTSQRRRFSRVKNKPNLGSSTPAAPTKPPLPDIRPSSDHSLKDASSSVTTEQPLGGSTSGHEDLKHVEENEHPHPADSSTKEESTSVKSGLGDCNLDGSAGAAGTNTQQVIDPTAGSSKSVSSESAVVSADTSSSVKSTDDGKSELTDSSQTSIKAPQTRRGRFIKPKPTLAGRTRRLQQQEAKKDTSPTESVSGSCLPDVETSADQKLVPELRPDAEKPAVGVTDESHRRDPPLKGVAPSLGVLEKPDQSPRCAAETCSRQIPSSSTEGIQTHPMLKDMLPDNVPSDPDEPFFILSLTEIPVSSSEEAARGAAEPPPSLTVTDASVQAPSVSGESLVSAGEQSLCNVVKSSEGSADTGLSQEKDKGSDAAASNDFTMEDPESSQGTGSVSVESQKCSRAADSNESATTAEKQKPSGPGRRAARSRVKPSVTKKKQTSKEAESAQESEHAGTSVQPGAFDHGIKKLQKERSCNVDTESQREPDSGSNAEKSQRTGTAIQRRTRAKTANDPPPSKAASSGSKAKAPSAKRKQSSQESAASTSHDTTCTWQPKEIHAPAITSPPETEAKQTSDPSSKVSDPQTLQYPVEVSDSQPSVSLMSSSQEDEEPISVSQYFLSDIFTEVEDV